MAVQLESYLRELLATLPPSAERRFIAAQYELVAAYLERQTEPLAASAPAPALVYEGPPRSATDEADAPPATTERDPTRVEQGRVKLVGRVGAPPVFRTTKRGVRIGTFPLAVHEGDSTQWYKVLAFNNPAKNKLLADKLASVGLVRGQQVEVVGFHETVNQTKPDGTSRSEEQVKAVAFRPR